MSPTKSRGRFELRSDKDVDRWYRNTARGALSTADNYLRVFGLFCEQNKITPRQFIKMGDKARTELLEDHIDSMLKKGKSPAYAGVLRKSALSWVKHNGKSFIRDIRIRGSHLPFRRVEIPSQDQLRAYLNIADAQGKVTVALIAFSGLRPEVLGDYHGDKGLTLRDLPETSIVNNELVFEKIPCRIVVPPQLSKTLNGYMTFLGPEGCEYLKAYFQQRAMVIEYKKRGIVYTRGEKFTKDSPVITPTQNRKKPFIRSLNISGIIKKYMCAARIDGPPYNWRSYFSTGCMQAQRTGLPRDYQEHFMGHRGGIEHTYSFQKSIRKDTVEDMRDAYSHILPFVETRHKSLAPDPMKYLKLLLMAQGYTDEGIKNLDITNKTEEEIIEIIQHSPNRAVAEDESSQKVIPIAELESALKEGWIFKSVLPGNKAVIERQHTGKSAAPPSQIPPSLP